MSTIPGGCFVAADSLRRLSQKRHAQEAKQQQATEHHTLLQSPPLSPPVDHHETHSLAKLISSKTFGSFDVWDSWKTCAEAYCPKTRLLEDAPLRLTEIFSRTRSYSTPVMSPPLSPTTSPQKKSFEEHDIPPSSPILIPNRSSLARVEETGVGAAGSQQNSLSQSL